MNHDGTRLKGLGRRILLLPENDEDGKVIRYHRAQMQDGIFDTYPVGVAAIYYENGDSSFGWYLGDD
jgi:hypothetical protein